MMAQTLLLSQGPLKVALVSCDMLTIPDSLVRAVKSKIPNDIKLFLAADHTHCAPDSQMLNDRMTLSIPGIASYKPRWLDWYSSKIAACVLDATKKRSENYTHLALDQRAVDVNHARRPFGKPDPIYSVLLGNGHPIFGTFAAHATLYGDKELRTRRDWPGALSDALRAPVFVGAIGDVSPKAVGNTPRNVSVTWWRQ